MIRNPMLPRYRHRQSLSGVVQQRQPRIIIRILIALAALFIAWYLVTKVLALFDYSVGRRAATLLNVRSGGDSVEVSLQGGDWQHAETGLKLYEGDAIQTHNGGDVLLTFFDGTRIRMDQNSEIAIEQSDRYDKSTSGLEIKVRSGKIWEATPSLLAYSGAIIRTVSTQNFVATVPASTQALISSQNVSVLRASGVGITVNLSAIKSGAEIIVGEGQFMALNDDAKAAIKAGKDPYDYRDPLTQQMLKDDFLASSYALLTQDSVPTQPTVSSGSVATDDTDDLIVNAPVDKSHATAVTATVSGKVSNRVALVLVNGQNVTIKKDLTFSVDMSLSKDPTTNLHIEAQDAQGITLQAVDRTVINDYKPVVEPVKIKSPVASGGTLKTSQKEIEITGDAPVKTTSIMMNDYRLQLYKPGDKTWSYLASTQLGNLVPGTNTFTVYALDADGNKSPPRTITIVLDFSAPESGSGSVVSSEPPLKQNPPLQPGSVTVTAPEAGTSTTTDQKEIVIEGTTSADTYSISVNGYTLSLYKAGKTTWNYIASTDLQTMKRGANVYRIVARNSGGEILDVLEYTINFKP